MLLRRIAIALAAQRVADEGQQHGHDRVREEAADEDPIVVDAVELRPDRAEHGVERREDRDGRVPRELEPDVDLEGKAEQDADEQGSEPAGQLDSADESDDDKTDVESDPASDTDADEGAVSEVASERALDAAGRNFTEP